VAEGSQALLLIKLADFPLRLVLRASSERQPNSSPTSLDVNPFFSGQYGFSSQSDRIAIHKIVPTILFMEGFSDV